MYTIITVGCSASTGKVRLKAAEDRKVIYILVDVAIRHRHRGKPLGKWGESQIKKDWMQKTQKEEWWKTTNKN
jgi:hypothetical protein